MTTSLGRTWYTVGGWRDGRPRRRCKGEARGTGWVREVCGHELASGPGAFRVSGADAGWPTDGWPRFWAAPKRCSKTMRRRGRCCGPGARRPMQPTCASACTRWSAPTRELTRARFAGLGSLTRDGELRFSGERHGDGGSDAAPGMVGLAARVVAAGRSLRLRGLATDPALVGSGRPTARSRSSASRCCVPGGPSATSTSPTSSRQTSSPTTTKSFSCRSPPRSPPCSTPQPRPSRPISPPHRPAARPSPERIPRRRPSGWRAPRSGCSPRTPSRSCCPRRTGRCGSRRWKAIRGPIWPVGRSPPTGRCPRWPCVPAGRRRSPTPPRIHAPRPRPAHPISVRCWPPRCCWTTTRAPC